MIKQLFSRVNDKIKSRGAVKKLSVQSPDNAVRPVFACRMQYVDKNRWNATAADPWFSVELPYPSRWVYLKCAVPPRRLYYADEKNPAFSAGRETPLCADACRNGVFLQFPYPVRFLRFDPTEEAGPFSLDTLTLQCSNTCPQQEVTAVHPDYEKLSCPQAVAEFALQQKEKNTQQETVLVFTHEMHRTGAPQLCLNLIRELRKQGKAVLVATLVNGSMYPQFCEEADFVFFVEREPVEREEILFRTLYELGVRKALLNTVASGAYAKPLEKYGFRIIALIHEMRATVRICGSQEAGNAISHYAQTVVFPSQVVKQSFESVVAPAEQQSYCFHQGLYRWQNRPLEKQEARKKLHQLLKIDEDANVIVSAGTLGFGKGADVLPLLLQQCRKLSAEKAKKLCFVWLGTGTDYPYAVWLEEQIKNMDMDGQIRFAGYVADAELYQLYLTGADAFLLPSREDSMPSVLFEAMACRTPVLSFRQSGGAEEIISDHRGVLVPFFDLEEMAKKLFWILSSPGGTEKMMDEAQEYVKEKGNFTSYVKKICELWDAKIPE